MEVNRSDEKTRTMCGEKFRQNWTNEPKAPEIEVEVSGTVHVWPSKRFWEATRESNIKTTNERTVGVNITALIMLDRKRERKREKFGMHEKVQKARNENNVFASYRVWYVWKDAENIEDSEFIAFHMRDHQWIWNCAQTYKECYLFWTSGIGLSDICMLS